jgi:hypothetical protein
MLQVALASISLQSLHRLTTPHHRHYSKRQFSTGEPLSAKETKCSPRAVHGVTRIDPEGAPMDVYAAHSVLDDEKHHLEFWVLQGLSVWPIPSRPTTSHQNRAVTMVLSQ